MRPRRSRRDRKARCLMEHDALMKALVLAKRFGNLLNEVLDLSRQIAEAVDRSDPVSVQMLVAMRQDPINKLQAAEQALKELAPSLPDPAQQERLSALLNGAQPEDSQEQMLSEQMTANRRRLQQVLELDQVLNRKVAREKTAYSGT